MYTNEKRQQKNQDQASEVSVRYTSSDESVPNNVVSIRKSADKVPMESVHLTKPTSSHVIKFLPVPKAKTTIVVYNTVGETITVIMPIATFTPANIHLTNVQTPSPTSSVKLSYTFATGPNDDMTLTEFQIHQFHNVPCHILVNLEHVAIYPKYLITNKPCLRTHDLVLILL